MLGAGIGGGLRYMISGAAYRFLPEYFPFGTLLVNFLGSLLLGLIVFISFEKTLISPPLKNFLTTGFCGGFTTFSTFSFETFNLMRQNEYLFAALNIAGNVLLTLLGIAAAFFLSRQIQ